MSYELYPSCIRFFLAAVVVLATGCGSSQTAVTAPDTVPIRCALTVATPNGEVPAQGGEGTVSVSASRDCTWSAGTEGGWLSIMGARSGQGDGTISFRAAANADPATRRGAVVLNDTRLEIVQAAAACEISLAESAAVFGQAGGTGQIDVLASSAMCGWTSTTDQPWVVLGPREGQGSGRIRFDVQPSTGPPRSAQITVAGERFSIIQGDGCVYHVEPASVTFPAAGGTAPVRLTTGPACAWTAVPGAPWITVAGPASGTGSATVTLAVTGSSGAARTGTATIAGHPVFVSQLAADAPAPAPPDPLPPTPPPPVPPPPAPACTYAMSPGQTSLPGSGGSGTFRLETSAACAWTAASTAPWITVVDQAGTGTASIRFEVPANAGAPRTGAITAGGRTFTVEQAGACVYGLSATTRTLPAEGGVSAVEVTTGSSCSWTSASSDSWLTITEGTTGEGNGIVRFSAAAHTGSERTARLTVAGHVVTVVQRGGCTFGLSPAEASIGAQGGGLTVAVSAAGGCAWTASSGTPWIAISQGSSSGTGEGQVRLQVEANPGTDARKGTATIAGRTFTVTQEAAPPQPDCRAAIEPASVEASAGGGPSQLRVTIGSSCAWRSEPGVPWIRVTAGAESTGSGPVLLQIERNTGPARKGIVTIAGVQVAVTQGGGN